MTGACEFAIEGQRLRVVIATFTLMIDGLAVEGPARVVDGRARLVPDSAWAALGSNLTLESDLEAIATTLDRPLAVDVEE